MIKRVSYDDFARALAAGDPPAPTAAPRGPCACDANGCPVVAPVVMARDRLCCVHRQIRERALWDQATDRLRHQIELVDVAHALRRGGLSQGDLDRIAQACPEARHERDGLLAQGAMLYAAEALLIAVGTGERARDLLAAPFVLEDGRSGRELAIENLQWLADHGARQVGYLMAEYERVFGEACPIDLWERSGPVPTEPPPLPEPW